MSPVRATPELIAMRISSLGALICRLRSASAFRIARAASTAFSAWSVLLEGRAEHRQQRVAEELVERAFVLEDDVRHAGQERVEQLRRFDRRERLAHRREADEIAEHDGDVAFLRHGLGVVARAPWMIRLTTAGE